MSGEHPISTVAIRGDELSRLLQDPGFSDALRTAWQGVGSLDDAVHWRQYPLTQGPSGATDPALELAALKAKVYSRPEVGEDVVDLLDDAGAPVRLGRSEARLLELERSLARRNRWLDEAIAAARRALLPTEPGEAPPEPTWFARQLRRHPVPIFAAAATLLVSLVVPMTSVAIAPDLRPSAMLLKVFNRPQGVIDIAPQVFSGGQPGYTSQVRATTRFLGLYYGVAVFAYQNSAEQVCMLTTAAGDHDVSVCVSVRSFARSGLAIRGTNYGVTDASAGVTAATRLAFRWGPDSELSVQKLG
jgi:hypothetical protein